MGESTGFTYKYGAEITIKIGSASAEHTSVTLTAGSLRTSTPTIYSLKNPVSITLKEIVGWIQDIDTSFPDISSWVTAKVTIDTLTFDTSTKTFNIGVDLGISLGSELDFLPGDPSVDLYLNVERIVDPTVASIANAAVGAPSAVTGTNLTYVNKVEFKTAKGTAVAKIDTSTVTATTMTVTVPAGAETGVVHFDYGGTDPAHTHFTLSS